MVASGGCAGGASSFLYLSPFESYHHRWLALQIDKRHENAL